MFRPLLTEDSDRYLIRGMIRVGPSDSMREETGEARETAATDALPFIPPRGRVLIVDDMRENRLMLGLCCDQFGLAHEGADSGRAAVEAARSGRFDVILMDIFMPGMDGMGATMAIRELPGPVSATPIIAVTTAASPGECLRYRSCGMTDVVAKPVQIARLAEALSAAFMATRRARRSSRNRPVERIRASA